MNAEILEKYGINYQNGLARCLDDEEFYQNFLKMFLEDTSYERAKEAFNHENYTDLFACCHELKGVCGNADMTDLFKRVSEEVEVLRKLKRDDKIEKEEPEVGAQKGKIEELFSEITKEYERVKEGILLAVK